MPVRVSDEPVLLATITIEETDLVVTLGNTECRCRIWEHTVHELEMLSTSIRTAAHRGLPDPIRVPRPDSWIGDHVHLPLAVETELGYSLEEPGQGRARFFCYPIEFGRPRLQGVGLAVGMNGAYGEVVLEVPAAHEFADWIDSQLAEITSEG